MKIITAVMNLQTRLIRVFSLFVMLNDDDIKNILDMYSPFLIPVIVVSLTSFLDDASICVPMEAMYRNEPLEHLDEQSKTRA